MIEFIHRCVYSQEEQWAIYIYGPGYRYNRRGRWGKREDKLIRKEGKRPYHR